MSQESVIDTSKPNPGRIYDYVLGGSHNFEVDRLAAERLMKMVPFMREGMRLQRWCLQDLAVELAQNRGFDVIIDFASGLPTNDHIHHVVPKGTTVVYSDYDPIIVEYSKEIIQNTPDVHYFQADARKPEELLNSAAVQEILKGRRDVALVFWGVGMFISDEDIAHVTQYLYDWSGPKSCLAFNAQGVSTRVDDPTHLQTANIYKQMGTTLRYRLLEQYKQLIQPWKLDEKGFISFLEWHNFDPSLMPESVREISGGGGGNYGAYLIK